MIHSIKDQMAVAEDAYDFENKKTVMLIIGVNGVGKTTSVGKLAGQYKNAGKKVLLAAADTFRAGSHRAVDRMGPSGRRGYHCRTGRLRPGIRCL